MSIFAWLIMSTTTAHAHTCREDVLGGVGLGQRRDAVATAEDVENAQLQVRLAYQPALQQRRHNHSDVNSQRRHGYSDKQHLYSIYLHA